MSNDDPGGTRNRPVGDQYSRVGGKYTGIAPAQKTGVSSAVRAKPAAEYGLLLEGLGKTLDASLTFFKKFKKQEKQGNDKEFSEALQETLKLTLEEVALGQLKEAVLKVPFGNVLLTTIRYSEAFAKGVGEGLEKVNTGLGAAYDFGRLSRGEMTERDIAIMQQVRRWLSNSAAALPDVLSRGLAGVAEQLIKDLFGGAQKQIGKVLKEAAGQIAKNLLEQNDVLAVFNAALEGAARDIPAARGKAERLTFHFAMNAFIAEFGSEGLAERIKSVLDGIKSPAPVGVAVLGGIIEVIMYGTAGEYAKATRLPADLGWGEIRQALIDKARELVIRNREQDIAVEAGDHLDVAPQRVVIPTPLFREVTREAGGPSAAEINRFNRRYDEYLAMRPKWKLALEALARQYQRQIYAAPEDDRYELRGKLSGQLTRRRLEFYAQKEQIAEQIIGEFGENFDHRNLRTWLNVGQLHLFIDDLPLPDLVDEPPPTRR
jgi:hypothetical protein